MSFLLEKTTNECRPTQKGYDWLPILMKGIHYFRHVNTIYIPADLASYLDVTRSISPFMIGCHFKALQGKTRCCQMSLQYSACKFTI